MKAIKNVARPIVIGLTLFSIDFAAVMADITYTYKGNKFNEVTPGGSYTNKKITGSFSLPTPLPPNQIYSGVNLPVFSFSDGINKLNDKNISFFSSFKIVTDAKGDIEAWDLSLWRYKPDPPKIGSEQQAIITRSDPNGEITNLPGNALDLGQIGTCENNGCFSVRVLSSGAIWHNPGTWKTTEDNTSSSSQTGLKISKSGRLAFWANGFLISRLPAYYTIGQPLFLTCPVDLSVSCIALAAEVLAVSLFESYQVSKIISDPPDPLYSEIFQPRQYPASVLDSSSGFSQELIDAANTAFRDQTELASLMEAWRVTLERHNAAQAVNDKTNMLRQGAALDDYIIQTSRLATLVQQSSDEFLDQLEELTGPVLISPDQMQEAMNTLALDGFNDLVLDRLSSFSLGFTEIEELRSMLLEAQPLSVPVDFYSVARSTEGSYGDISALTRYVEDSYQLVAEAGPDQTVFVGDLVILDGSGSFDPDNDLLSFSWTQTGGPTVTLNGATIGSQTFTPMEVGNYTFSLVVSDGQGQESTDSVTVTVIYNFTGFFPPVDNPPILNSVKAGRAVPVKFSLNGDHGLDIFDSGSPSSRQITCDVSAPIGGVEETIATGGSSLSYDALTDQYIYVWKTSKSWAGTCRQLSVRLKDESEHQANFKFTK